MSEIVDQTFVISNRLGMHARAATKFVQTAQRFSCHVEVEKDGQTVNGKSIMGLLMLVAAQGTSIRICTRGADARAALQALGKLVEDKFGET